MYFVLSKVLGFVVTPSNTIALICIAGVVLLLTRFRRSGIGLAIFGVALLAVVGWSPVSNWIFLPLADRFPAWQATADPDGIIILGGAINPEISASRNALEINSSSERLVAMLQLARRYPNARIVYSGGSAALLGNGIAEAPIAGKLADEFEFSRKRLLLETTSRTTEENALDTRDLVQPKAGERWLLVTSAWHMPRSVGLFRKAGFRVEAYPVDFRADRSDAYKPSGTISHGIERADVAVHEWVGLLAAWLGGKSDDFFPGPR